ncbi:hypothetical protein TPENAI_61174 [Tenacibaculum litopenaei]|uniref:hypothetical protein n=1 Tax=Tenacibaculum litopenaei TaxID=396016 RepID=UPI0038930F48
MDDTLKYKIQLAIDLLADYKGLMTYDKIMGLFKNNGINFPLINNIYIFLPIVFCRRMLPNVNFPDSYIEKLSSEQEIKKSYLMNDYYNIIDISVRDYINKGADSETILKIASLSSEFNAINEVLMNGGKLEDVNLTETVILL